MTWGVGLTLIALAIAITLLGRPALGVLLIIATVIAMLFVLTDRDAVTILTIFLVAVLLIPSRMVVGPLGAIGTPARLLGLAAMVWWLASRLNRSIGGDHGQQPLRAAVLAFTWWMLLSYGFAQLRDLQPLEAGGADRRAIVTVAMAGIALLAMDGIPNRERLELLLRRLVALGGVVAIIGLLQFFGTDLVVQMRLPGLTLNRELNTIIGFRGGLPRVTATAVHAIEFAVIMSLLLPFALHFAFYGKGRRWTAWLWTGAILLALPVSVSRSSLVAVAVSLPVLMVVWSWKARLTLIAFGIGVLGVLASAVEGLVATLTGLFQNVETNYSIQARIEDYEAIYGYVSEQPFIGRGAGTFNPEVYFYLDNQWLMTTVSTGLVGLALLALIYIVAFACMRGVQRRTDDDDTRHLAQAFIAVLVTFALTFALFDAFAFGINAGLFYLAVGLAGALWRIEIGSSYVGRDHHGRLRRPERASPQPAPLLGDGIR